MVENNSTSDFSSLFSISFLSAIPLNHRVYILLFVLIVRWLHVLQFIFWFDFKVLSFVYMNKIISVSSNMIVFF